MCREWNEPCRGGKIGRKKGLSLAIKEPKSHTRKIEYPVAKTQWLESFGQSDLIWQLLHIQDKIKMTVFRLRRENILRNFFHSNVRAEAVLFSYYTTLYVAIFKRK